MAASRIEKLLSFIAARPADPFPKYALALEHRNAGAHAEAWQVFQGLIAAHPDYTAAYLHAGNALLALGQREQAREIWTTGVMVCTKQGDAHARGELEGALAAAS